MAEITDQKIKIFANIFADVFRQKGMMAGDISSVASKPSGSSKSNPLNDYRLQIKKEELVKKNNRLLNEYIALQKIATSNTKKSNKAKSDQLKIQKVLKTDSILLGESYVSAVKAFDSNKLSKNKLTDFAADTDLSKLTKTFGSKIEDAGDEMSTSLSKTAEDIHTKTGRFVNKSFNMLERRGLLTASFVQFASEFRSTLKYGTDLTRSFVGREWDALKMGISPTELVEIEAKNKRLVNAMGGAGKFEDAVSSGSSTMFKFYGDLGEATKGTIQALNALSLGGIKPSMNMMMDQNGELSALNKTMFEIRSMTGRTFAEQNAAMEQYIQSDNTKTKLAGLSNSKDRFNMVMRDQSNKKMLASLGLTADQADRVSESFNSITDLNPKDRLKESYKATAIASAMGIENASVIGDVMRAGGIDKVSKEKAAEYANVMTQLSKKQAEATGGQVTSTGLVTSALLGHASALETQVKASKDLVLSDEEAAKKALENSQKEYGALGGSVVNGIQKGLAMFDLVTTGLGTNSLLTGIFGTIGYIATLMRGISKGNRSYRKSRNGKGGYDDLKSSKDKKKGLYSRTKENISTKSKSIKAGSGKIASSVSDKSSKLMGSSGKMMSKGLSATKSMGSKALSMGGKMLGKLAWPIMAAQSVSDAIHGWKDADKTFDVKNITTGMKAASALGGLVEGLTFGLVDASSVAKTVYGDVKKVKQDATNIKPIDTIKPIDNIAKPIDKIKPAPSLKTEIPKVNKEDPSLLMQQQIIKLQEENTKILALLNVTISENLEKIHAMNTKKLKSSQNLENIVDKSNSKSTSLMDFNDDEYVFS